MFTLKAPAKINLTLEVLRRRPDGYHEIHSVLQTIDLCDTISLNNSEDITIACDIPEWSVDNSQVFKAVTLLQEYDRIKKGVEIRLKKLIPLRAGLGGDSSDAAATLRGLNDLWKLTLSEEKLLMLAARLGSDAPFFIRGGVASVSGRGEIITTLPPLPPMWVVLVVPNIPVAPGKTARMYASLKQSYFTDGSMTQRLVDTLHKGEKLDSSLLFNIFENIAFDIYPGLGIYKEHLTKLGAPRVHLAGSGPTLFAIFSDKSRAEEIHARVKKQGMKSFLATMQ
jgi:4-diphosphocytidyl-2-C-methyl-D-erythritol kinase